MKNSDAVYFISIEFSYYCTCLFLRTSDIPFFGLNMFDE